MNQQGYSLFELDNTRATDQVFEQLDAFSNLMRAERWPEEPPRPKGEFKKQFFSQPPFVKTKIWLAFAENQQEVAGIGMAQILVGMEENQHMAQCDIQVHPDHRRKGLGKTLLGPVSDFCRQNQRSLLIFPTDSLVPAGEDFIRSIGGMLGLAQTINQLNLDEVNRELLQRWQQKGRQQCPDYEIGTWVGAIPEEHLEAYVAIKNVMNTAPKDDLDVEDIFITPDQVRQMEAMEAVRGITRWTMFVRNPENGEIAGFTEVTVNPSTPQTLTQGDTGVSPKYRARGIGRWLKAAMVETLLQEQPQALRIRTGNATTNEPMLRINAEMGFKIYKTIDFWQVNLEKVEKYLSVSQE